MIEGEEVKTNVCNEGPDKEVNFLDGLVWKENNKGKWFLDKRECLPLENNANAQEINIVTFDYSVYEFQETTDVKIEAEDFIYSEMGKFKVNKIEEGQAFLKSGEEEIPVPLENCRKEIKINFLIIGKTQTFQIENIPILLNKKVSYIKDIISEFLNIPIQILIFYFKENKLEDDTNVFDLEITEKETITICFKESNEYEFKRSTSKDYSWSDAKSFIPFTVDKNITVTALGFYRDYENKNAEYDLMIYQVEKNNNVNRKLIYVSTGIKVGTGEVDAQMVKKVNVTPFQLDSDYKYYAYLYYKLPDQKTYYSYSGTANNLFEGVNITFLEENENGYRSSATSGHLPYIYFKICNPFDK